ncbi:MAG: formate dehydrogenase accessory sulfurtransferase FdhD [Bacillota bacterium]|nr:formate dehydrogenase accessory sulfurtransferase FdhD [Bacillota bacterium]
MEPVTAVVIRRIRAQSEEETGDVVAREYPVTLVCRGEGSGGSGWELATLMCTPEHLDELALGFLYTGGLLSFREEVRGVEVEAGADAGRVVVTLAPTAETRVGAWRAARREDWQAARPVTTGCGYAALVGDEELPRVGGNLRVTVAEIMGALTELGRAAVHRETGATHAAALACKGGIVCLREDVGRHNAIDKIAGWWLTRCEAGVAPAGDGGDRTASGGGGGRVACGGAPASGQDEGLVVLTTGRLSSDIVLKVGRLGAEVLVSRAAPTSLGIRLAYLTGLTLVGFARVGHLNVYTFPERVLTTPG